MGLAMEDHAQSIAPSQSPRAIARPLREPVDSEKTPRSALAEHDDATPEITPAETRVAVFRAGEGGPRRQP